MTPLNFVRLIDQLREIAMQADRERLLVWYPEFCREYPNAAAVIEECLALPPEMVRLRLEEKYPLLKALPRLFSPEWSASFDQALAYLHHVLTERKKLNA